MWIPLAIAASFFMALTGFFSKVALKDLPPILVFTMQSVIVGLASLPLGLFSGSLGKLKTMDSREFLFILGACVSVCLASLCNFGALAAADASKVQPLAQLSLVFGLIMAFLFLKEDITPRIIAGAVMIVIGALLIAGGPKK